MPLTSIAREELLALHKESVWSEYVFVNSKTFELTLRKHSRVLCGTECFSRATYFHDQFNGDCGV